MLKNQRGSVATAELIIMMIILMVVTFGGVDYWVTLNQFQQAEHLKNQYLDTARLYGCLPEGKEAQLISDFKDLGFKDIEITTSSIDGNTTYTETEPAIRKIGEADIPEILLKIEGKFKENKFWMSSALNKEENEETTFRLQGTTYSEYVEKD